MLLRPEAAIWLSVLWLGYGLENRGNEVRFSIETGDCSSGKHPDRPLGTPCLYLNAYRGSFPGCKEAKVGSRSLSYI